MAFVDWADGGLKRLVWLVEMAYEDTTDTDQTLYLCDRHGPGRNGWTDPESGQVYLGYVDRLEVTETCPWFKDLVRGAWPAPVCRWSMSLPATEGSFGDPEAFKALMTGRPYNRSLVVSVVEVDEAGREIAREEVFRGVTANRGPDRWQLDPEGGRVSMSWAAEGWQGAMSRPIPLDGWAPADSSTSGVNANVQHAGTACGVFYAAGYFVDTDVTNNGEGGFWVQVPMLKFDDNTSPNEMYIGICSHEIDDNPVGGGQWLTTDGSFASGMRKTQDDGDPNPFLNTGTRPIVSGYPKLESGWLSDSGADAFVLKIEVGSEVWQDGLNLWAKIWGRNSQSSTANAYIQVEEVVWDLVTNIAGVSDFFDFTGPSLGMSDCQWTATERESTVAVPGVKLSKDVPVLGEVVGEILGVTGIGLKLDHDSANNDELRAQWFFRTWNQTDTPDHSWTLYGGLIRSWKVKTAWSQTANNVTIESAERATHPLQRALTANYDSSGEQASDTSKVYLTRYTYQDVNATAEGDDNATLRKTVSLEWLGPHFTAGGGGTVSFEDWSSALIDHLGERLDEVTCEFYSTQGWGVRLGDTVEWADFPAETAANLPGGSIGQVWERRLEVAAGTARTRIRVAHADLTF